MKCESKKFDKVSKNIWKNVILDELQISCNEIINSCELLNICDEQIKSCEVMNSCIVLFNL